MVIVHVVKVVNIVCHASASIVKMESETNSRPKLIVTNFNASATGTNSIMQYTYCTASELQIGRSWNATLCVLHNMIYTPKLAPQDNVSSPVCIAVYPKLV